MLFQAALVLLHTAVVMGAMESYGVQMGPVAGHGTFVSSFVKDPTSGRLLLTGSSYDMGKKNMAYRCFLATMDQDGFALQHSYGHSAVDENDPMSTSQACSHLLVHENRVFLAGHSGSDTTGNLEALYNRGAVIRNYRYGFVMDLMRNAETESKFDLLGGLVLQQAAAVYPISTASSPSDDTIYIASMKSDQSTVNGAGLPAMDPNLVLPVGKTYGLILESYGIQNAVPSGNITKTLVQKHRAFYQPGNGGSVYVAGMLKINDDTLIVAGHTYGQGRGFGKSASSQNILEASESLDGFVTKFTSSGLVPSISDENGVHSTFRVESPGNSSEFIYGMCGHGYGVNADGNHVYIVGATTGSLGVTGKGKAIQDAFIMKLQVGTTDEMQVVWIRQLSIHEQDATAEARLFGISCAVSPVDGHVWWAGHVTNGARVRSAAARAFGGQDIFVEKLVVEDGDVVFTKQFGSSRDDEIAWHGGLQVDDQGNAILVGNTLGPLFRQKTDFDNSDVFATTITRDGKIYLPFDEGADINGGHILPPITESDIEEEEDSSKQMYFALIFVVAVLVSAVFLGMLYMRGRHSHYEATTDRAKVIRYLNEFDVEDVELKHSATGGWHCSYANGLAQGKVKLPYSDTIRNGDTGSIQSGADPLTRPLNLSDESSSYSSRGASRKSLFTDEYDSLFATDNNKSSRYGKVGSRLRAEEDERGFGSLVDDYSALYSDRRSEKSKSAGRWGQHLV